MYIANLGDSSAKLFRRIQDGYLTIKLTNTLNAKNRSEQIRLKKLFPDDDEIVVNNKLNNSFYVKGKLQPTRTLGDYFLKHKEFNEPTMSMDERYHKRSLKNFKGPYISHLPEIGLYDLHKDDEFIVMASDGLWDLLTVDEVQSVVSKYKEKAEIARNLLDYTVDKAAYNANLSKSEVYGMDPGFEKRGILDDITIMVVDLKDQRINPISIQGKKH